MDRSTAKLRILLILLVLSSECVFFPLIAADSLNYDRLSKMSIDDLFDLSESYKNKNLLDSSLGCYILLAGRYYDKMPSTEKYLCAKACKEAGIAYYYKYNYTKALDFLRQGVKYCEENDIPELLPSLYNNIGCVYSSLNDFRISINSFEKGLTISRELNDRTNEKILLTNLACHCSNENIKEKAELYNRELMEQFGQEDSTITFYVHLNRGWLMYNDSCYSQAVACLNQALDYARKARLAAAHESVVYETLGALYMNIPNKRDSAYYYLKTNCTFAQEHHLLPNLRNTLTKLAECYEQDGQKDKAMSYKIHYWELSDSLLDSNKFNQAKSEHFLYQMEQDYEKIKRLNQETLEKEEQIRTSRIQLLCSLAILLIFTVLTTITIIQKRKLHRAYSDLFHRNATILSSEEENRRKHARQEKELEHAKARGAKIYAEVAGVGMSADAYHLTASHPEGLGAKLVMLNALEDAEMDPKEVDYINVHGTSTPVGDISEAKAIKEVFGDHAFELNISSTKSMTGHLLGAAGAVEAIASIMAIQNDIVPPTINHEEGDNDENIDYNLNFTFNKAQKREVNVALSNTFGFGGHNACVIFKKYAE